MPCDGRWSSVCLCWLKVLLLQFHIHIARSKYWCLILQFVNIGWEGLFQSTIRKIHSTVQEILYSFISSKATFTKTTQHITTNRTTGRKTMGCILALSKTHMAASTTRSRCKFVCYPRLQTSNCNCRCKVQVEVVIRKSLQSWKANLATTQFSLAPILPCPVNLWWVW